jgi:hypothetical protein
MITAYKGFNKDWTCRGFQYKVGETYKQDGEAVACESGFHACENPLDVLNYYPPTGKFAEVQMIGAVDREAGSDTKVAASEIYVKVELSLHDFIGKAVEWMTSNAKVTGQHLTGHQSAASSTGDRSAASATGYRSAASSTGDQSAASATGDRSAASATGDRSAASATGRRSAASATGYQSAASSTGDRSAASSTGDRSAASATGRRSAASSTGDQSAASATGDRSAASATGRRSAASATGYRSAAMGAGYENKAMGAAGCAIFLVERDGNTYDILNARGFLVGRDCKANQWYMLKNNELVEVD